MIDDDVLAVVDADAAAHLPGFVAAAEADIADHHVVGGDAERLPAQADSVSGGRLPGDRETGVS